MAYTSFEEETAIALRVGWLSGKYFRQSLKDLEDLGGQKGGKRSPGKDKFFHIVNFKKQTTLPKASLQIRCHNEQCTYDRCY